MRDELEVMLRDVESRSLRPLVHTPDPARLPALGQARRRRRIAFGLVALLIAAFTVQLFTRGTRSGPGPLAPRVWGDPALIAALERVAALRLDEALRSPSPRVGLQRIVTVYPDTISAQRAAILLRYEVSR